MSRFVRSAWNYRFPPALAGRQPTATTGKETTMGGELDEAKGRVKEAAGDLTDDDDLRRAGKIDKGTGKVKNVVDTVSEKLKGD
jgi:uncharacterized protein YjbJ (UPF0337 family)